MSMPPEPVSPVCAVEVPGNTVEVLSLDDPSFRAVYTGNTLEAAVIAAYAQSFGDYNTWEYQKKYRWMLRAHPHSVSCGPFCALC